MFGRSKDKKDGVSQTPALPAPPPDPMAEMQAALRREFEKASCGASYARTLAFGSTVEGDQTFGKIWREAVLRPDGRWLVQDVHQLDVPGLEFMNAADGKGLCVRHEPLEGFESTTFIDALQKLSEFHVGHDTMKFLTDKDRVGEIAVLGDMYFVTLAESEGLVFEASGEIHPTHKGRIVTPGQFSAESRERARAAYERKRDMPLLSSLLRESEARKERLSGDVHPVDAIYMQRVAKILDNIEKNLRWADAHKDGFAGQDKGAGGIDFSGENRSGDRERSFGEWCDYYVALMEEVMGKHAADARCDLLGRGSLLEEYYRVMREYVPFCVEMVAFRKSFLSMKDKMHLGEDAVLEQFSRLTSRFNGLGADSEKLYSLIQVLLKEDHPVPEGFRELRAGMEQLCLWAQGQRPHPGQIAAPTLPRPQ